VTVAISNQEKIFLLNREKVLCCVVKKRRCETKISDCYTKAIEGDYLLLGIKNQFHVAQQRMASSAPNAASRHY
jgi:hypothetical protein